MLWIWKGLLSTSCCDSMLFHLVIVDNHLIFLVETSQKKESPAKNGPEFA
jgi:hypothetical protein